MTITFLLNFKIKKKKELFFLLSNIGAPGPQAFGFGLNFTTGFSFGLTSELTTVRRCSIFTTSNPARKILMITEC